MTNGEYLRQSDENLARFIDKAGLAYQDALDAFTIIVPADVTQF